jgi:hypothetical protein
VKRFLICALSLCLLLSACSSAETRSHAFSQILHTVQEHRELLLDCVKEMEAFGLERIYVAIEEPKKEEDEDEEETVTAEPAEPRLVSFEKETDDRTEIENETLENAIRTMGLELIFFQTASDARRVVIFSFSRENDTDSIQHGFYYSYDGQPAAWWGRKAELVHKDNKWLQISKNGDAWYYTLLLEDSFYYFEKNGYLMA